MMRLANRNKYYYYYYYYHHQIALITLIMFLMICRNCVINDDYCSASCSSFVQSHTLRHAQYKHHLASIAGRAHQEDDDADDSYLTTSAKWFHHQIVDHFAPEDTRTFSQRFYEYLDFFKNPSSGPIFLIIGGEATCYGISNDYIRVLAEHFGAAMVTLEHRYYGYSSPFSTLDVKNLRYLNSKQALSDLALFRQYYQDLTNYKYNLSHRGENTWITFGGSYSGALSAWFRLKYPHLTKGSHASSAVVHAIENYFQYDQQVRDSIGPKCSHALLTFKDNVNKYLDNNASSLKLFFGAEVIENNLDFLSLLADSTSVAVQYGFHQFLCKQLIQSIQEDGDILATYKDYMFNVIYKQLGVNLEDYSRLHLRKNIQAGPGSGSRLWTYQYCTEFGFFQTAPKKMSIRFTQLNQKYYLDLCQFIFDEETIPRSNLTNLFYGGAKIKGSNIFFVNGYKDPWKHASKLVSTENEPSYIVKCDNCAHCVDIEGCPQFPFNPQGNSNQCNPSNSIEEARKMIFQNIKSWLKDDD